jgi:hypothetical protein
MPRSRSEHTPGAAMAISPVSSSSAGTAQSQSDDGWRQFMQMVQAINAGDSNAAQQAYTEFTQSPAAKVASANPDSRLAKALDQIGQSLQSGDIGGAQKALQALRPHGHHHRHGSPSSGAAKGNGATQGESQSDPNAPGATVNLTV